MNIGRHTTTSDRVARAGFLVLVALLPVVRPLSFYIGGLRVSPPDVVFSVVALLWLLTKFRGGEKPAASAFHWLVALYAAALALSAIFSDVPQRSFLKLAGEFYLFGLAFIAYDLARDRGSIKLVSGAWLSGTAITVIASLAGFTLFYLGHTTQGDNYFLSHFGSLPAGNYPRIHALFANANMMCNFLNVSLMLSLLAGESGWIDKRFSRLLTAGIWFAAIFTFSAGLGGMLLSAGLWFGAKFEGRKEWLKSRAFFFAGVSASILVFAAVCLSPDTPNTDQQIVMSGSRTVVEPSVRVLVWQDALRTIGAHPIIGKGVGTDPVNVSYSTLSGQNQVLLDAHNLYLSILAQAGLVGFAAFAMLLLFLARRFAFDLRTERKRILTALSCVIIGALLYQGLTGSFEDARHLWILIGLFAGFHNYKEVSDPAASVAADV